MNYQENPQYNVIFREEPEGGYTAIVPSLPGCITYGETLEKTRELAIDAIRGYIFSLQKHNEPVPTDQNSFISSIPLTKDYQRTHA